VGDRKRIGPARADSTCETEGRTIPRSERQPTTAKGRSVGKDARVANEAVEMTAKDGLAVLTDAPGLRPAGSFEGPIRLQRVLFRTNADAITGINRADSASVNSIRPSRPVASSLSGRRRTTSAGARLLIGYQHTASVRECQRKRGLAEATFGGIWSRRE